MVYVVIGIILFTPIGFLSGYYQHQKDKKKEIEENKNLNT